MLIHLQYNPDCRKSQPQVRQKIQEIRAGKTVLFLRREIKQGVFRAMQGFSRTLNGSVQIFAGFLQTSRQTAPASG